MRTTRGALAMIALGAAAMLVFAVAGKGTDDTSPKPPSTEDVIRELKRRLDKLEGERAELQKKHKAIKAELDAEKETRKKAIQDAAERLSKEKKERARLLHQLRQDLKATDKSLEKTRIGLAKTDKDLGTTKQDLATNKKTTTELKNQLDPVVKKVTKITDGWFLIRSAMTGRKNAYLLDVRGGKADIGGPFGFDIYPILQLAGDDKATPQANRKFRLQLLD